MIIDISGQSSSSGIRIDCISIDLDRSIHTRNICGSKMQSCFLGVLTCLNLTEQLGTLQFAFLPYRGKNRPWLVSINCSINLPTLQITSPGELQCWCLLHI
ncbi:hypothetical protein HMPREF2725_01460 [Pseudomonas aeruginosa]|nr:hypothetical protein HMPREF2725_01460 [Pseudomonas aeruginosa]